MIEDREEMPQRAHGRHEEDDHSAARRAQPEPPCPSHLRGACDCEDDGEAATWKEYAPEAKFR